MSEARRLKVLEDENARLKKLLAEAMLDNTMLKDIASKNGNARRQTGGRGSSLRHAWGEPAPGVFDGRSEPDCGALSKCASRRPDDPGPVAGDGRRAPALRLLAPAAQPGGHPPEPQEAEAALPRRAPAGSPSRWPQASPWNPGTDDDATRTEPTLVARFPQRHTDGQPSLPCPGGRR